MFERKYKSHELVDLYYKYGSTTEAAKHCEASYETIRRACIKAGVKLDGRKQNGKVNPRRKATDEQLLFLCDEMNCIQIAKKYSMSPGQVYARLRSLGKNPTFGSRSIKDRVEAYGFDVEYDDSISLDKVVDKYEGVCQICGKPVDIRNCAGGHPRKNYPSIDHIIPLSKGGSHTWENVQLAHIGCNARKCDRLEV